MGAHHGRGQVHEGRGRDPPGEELEREGHEPPRPPAETRPRDGEEQPQREDQLAGDDRHAAPVEAAPGHPGLPEDVAREERERGPPDLPQQRIAPVRGQRLPDPERLAGQEDQPPDGEGRRDGHDGGGEGGRAGGDRVPPAAQVGPEGHQRLQDGEEEDETRAEGVERCGVGMRGKEGHRVLSRSCFHYIA